MTAKERFIDVITNKKLPTNLESVEVFDNKSLVDVIVKAGFASSNSQARRLVVQKGVRLNQVLMEDPNKKNFNQGDVLQVGKKKFIKLKLV